MEKTVEPDVIKIILERYGFQDPVVDQKMYIHAIEDDGWIKLIFRVTLANGKRLVVKIIHEDEDLKAEMVKAEKQSRFSETMRRNGIKTPARYKAAGNYVSEFIYRDLPCIVTVEDWCSEEITEITTELAYQIGALMARMHTISLANKCEIGCGTLFSAAYQNDVDAFQAFCEITRNEKLDQTIVKQLRTLHDEKLEHLRAVWETLPKAAIQGDISINNLVSSEEGLIVFDYNNAGDEVLISDLVMEGLLTACEMSLPDNTPASYREKIFPALLKGYLSIRPLSEAESKAAWEAYTLYHSLWFSRIIHHDTSLKKLVQSKNYDAANRLLKQMLADMTEVDDGRFRSYSNKC